MVTSTPPPGLARPLSAYAFESIAVSTTAIGFTQATMVPSGAHSRKRVMALVMMRSRS